MAAKKRHGSCTKAPQFKVLSKICKKTCSKKSSWVNAGCRPLKKNSIKRKKSNIKRSKRVIQKVKESLKIKEK